MQKAAHRPPTTTEEKRRFLRRFRSSTLHPGSDSSLVGVLIGYLIRLVLLGIALFGVGYYMCNKYFNGVGFRDGVKSELDRVLRASSSTLRAFRWKGDQAVSLEYTAQGGASSFFNSLQANRIRGRASWPDLLSQRHWNIRDFGITGLTINLRSGALTGAEGDTLPAAAAASPFRATPDFSHIPFKKLLIERFSVSWGRLWTADGNLTNALANVSVEDSVWKLAIEGGTLNQNWLRNLQLASLNASVEPSRIVLSDGIFALGKDGAGQLSGEITLGERPAFDLALTARSVSLEDLAAETFGQILTVTGDLELKITGTTGTASGIQTEGTFEVSSGRVRNLFVFGTLANLTNRPEVRTLQFDSGSAKLRTTQGRLFVDDLSLQSDATLGGKPIAMINGRFEFASTQALSEEQAKAGSEQSNQSGTATSSPAEPVRRSELNLDEESGATPPEENITGTLQIDVLSALMDGFPSLREKYFTLDGDYARIEVALEGPLASCSDKLARQIDEDIKLLVTRTQFEN